MKIKRVIEIEKEIYERITNRIKTMREEMRINDYYNDDFLPFDWLAIADSKPYEDRPQGEWINPTKNTDFSNRDLFSDCSICGHTQMDETNFCPNCGADMRGAKE